MNSHESASEKPTIVLLHGYLASSRYWARLTPHLVRLGYTVVTLDLLGFGKAPKSDELTYDYDDHIDYLHRQIEALAITKPFILVGHSMGALIAARYTLHYPQQIKDLTLLNPPLFKDTAEVRRAIRATGFHYRFLFDSKLRGIGWFMMRTLPFNGISPHSRASREGSMKHIIEATEITEDLKALEAPTTLFIGTKDRKEYLKNIKDIELSQQVSVSYFDVAHHAPVLRPGLITTIITKSTSAS